MPVATPVQRHGLGVRFWVAFAPLFSWLVILYFAPLLVLLSYAFMRHEYVRIVPEFTLENFAAVFTNSGYRGALFRTLYIAVTVTVVDMILAFPVAYFLVFYAGRFKAALTVLILLPLWSSYLVRVFAWRVILGYRGILNFGLVELGIIDRPTTIFLFNEFSMTLTLCYIWLPFMVLPLVTAFERLPRNLLEASADLGGGGITTFRRVIFPLVLPGLLAGGLSVFSLTSGDYLTPALIGGGEALIGNVIAEQFGVASNVPLGSAMAAMVLLVLFGLMAYLSRRGVLENL